MICVLAKIKSALRRAGVKAVEDVDDDFDEDYDEDDEDGAEIIYVNH